MYLKSQFIDNQQTYLIYRKPAFTFIISWVSSSLQSLQTRFNKIQVRILQFSYCRAYLIEYEFYLILYNFCLALSISMKAQQEQLPRQQSVKDRYIACMILAAVGDAMGYKQGDWEFNYSGQSIHKQMMALTNQQGIKALKINQQYFPYSDDTVMHVATAKALIQSELDSSLDQICTNIAKHYKQCMKQMGGRAPGATCINSAFKLNKQGTNWKDITFEKRGGGCGASMRAACIGLYYHNNYDKLIEVSIQSGRITHHNPLGYLGALVAALFTAFSINNIHPKEWLYLLMNIYLPKAQVYVGSNRQANQNINGGDWDAFQKHWQNYAFSRSMIIEAPKSDPVFPQVYGVEQREEAYLQYSINGWPGALGVDSVIIAYDALLSTLDYCDKRKAIGLQANKWEEVCLRGVLHGGDNDSTGTIVGAWYGALYGFQEVYQLNHCNLQNRKQIETLGAQLYQKTHSLPKKQDQE